MMKRLPKTISIPCSILLLCSVFSFAETEDPQRFELAKDGMSNAVIIIEKNAVPCVKTAAEELQLYISKVTGALIPISHAVDNKKHRPAIYVGESSHTKTLGFDSTTLKFEEFIVEISPHNIILMGRDDPKAVPFTCSREKFYKEAGTLLAVYTFLRDWLDIRWYFPGDRGEVFTRHKTVTLAPISKRVRPEFSPRETQLCCGPGLEISDADFQKWARRNRHGGFLLNPGHSFGAVIDRTYISSHPEYFAIDVEGKRAFHNHGAKLVQLCLSQKELVNVFANAAKKYFARDPSNIAFTVMPGDALNRTTCCQCPRCKQAYDFKETVPKELQLSRYVWSFVNKVAAAVKNEYPDRIILCCAYGNYRYPFPGMKFEPNIGVAVTVNRVGFGYQIGDAMKTVAKWSGLVKNIYIDENYHSGVIGADGAYVWVPSISPRRIAAEIKTRRGKIRGEPYDIEFLPEIVDPETGRRRKVYQQWMWDNLNLYIIAELNFDASQDVNTLITRYCSALYGPAGEEIKKLYSLLEQQWEEGPGKLGVTGYGQLSRNKALRHKLHEVLWTKIYPVGFIETLSALVKEAKTKIPQHANAVYQQRLELLERGIFQIKKEAGSYHDTRPFH